MYNQTEKQKEAERKLRSQGFRFDVWISAQDGNPNHGCMVMSKRGATRHGKEFKEIDPDGSVY
jgi:hypothetical protein